MHGQEYLQECLPVAFMIYRLTENCFIKKQKSMKETMKMSKHLILFGHGQGDPRAMGMVIKKQRLPEIF